MRRDFVVLYIADLGKNVASSHVGCVAIELLIEIVVYIQSDKLAIAALTGLLMGV